MNGERCSPSRAKGGAVLAAGVILAVVFGVAAWAQAPFETPPVFTAANLAPADLLAGKGFTVDSQVPVEGFLERFTIRADVGLFEAHGRNLLPNRVGEVKALQKLKAVGDTEEYLKAVGQAGARPILSAVNMLAHPVDTITGLPSGVERMFGRLDLGAQHIWAAAHDPDQSGLEATGKTTAVVLGYEAERRKLAKELGVDPYTSNPELRHRLDDVAWVRFAGRLTVNLPLAALAPASTVISATSWVNNVIYDTPMGDLIVLNEKKLQAMGVPESTIKAFMGNQWLTLSLKTSLVGALERISGVPGRADVIAFASNAISEDQARFVVGAAEMLARYHETVGPITMIQAPGPIVGQIGSGGIVIPAPVDYVAWTRRVAELSQRQDLRAVQRAVVLSGKMSPLAKKQFESGGWTVREGF